MAEEEDKLPPVFTGVEWHVWSPYTKQIKQRIKQGSQKLIFLSLLAGRAVGEEVLA